MEASEIVPDAIGKDPEGTGSTDKEALPPPVVVLGAKLNIGRNDGDLANGDDKNDADNAKKSKNIVITTLVLPQTLEDEEELDEQDGERNQPSNQNPLVILRIPELLRDLSWDRIGLRRMFPCFSLVIAVPTSGVYQGQLDKKPQSRNSDESPKWDRST